LLIHMDGQNRQDDKTEHTTEIFRLLVLEIVTSNKALVAGEISCQF
jgi:hypothetical protein